MFLKKRESSNAHNLDLKFNFSAVELFYDIHQYRPFRKDVSQYHRILSEWKGYTIPTNFSGEKILLLVGFKRKSQFDIDRWTIGLDQTKTRVKTIELPATQGWFPILFNDMIDNGMRNGIPNEFWKDVITVYDDGETVQQFTGNQNPLNCRVILLDSSGKVIFFNDRGFSVKALNQLREKI